MTDREAMQMALDALAHYANDETPDGWHAITAIEALRAALEQGEQEKSGWVVREVYFEDGEPMMHREPPKPEQEIVERGPWRAAFDKDAPKTVFVESDDFTHDVRLYVDGDFADEWQRLQYAQQIARMLNAFKLSTGEQEPVALHKLIAWIIDECHVYPESADEKAFAQRLLAAILHPKSGYTAPPQREWQGLTDDEIKATASLGIYEKPLVDFARAIEAKLKEKNT